MRGLNLTSVLAVLGASWVIWRLSQPSQAATVAAVSAQADAMKALPGETVQEYDDRMRAWEMATGQPMPTMFEGYGQAAVDAFDAQAIGPQNDHWRYTH